MSDRLWTVVSAVALLGFMSIPASAQGVRRAADGKPDLSGIWQVLNTANWDIQDHTASKGVPAGQGVVEGNEIPYQPAALATSQMGVCWWTRLATATLATRPTPQSPQNRT